MALDNHPHPRNILATRAAVTVDDAEWLRHRWHELGRTQAEIAEEAGCSIRTVRSRLRRFGISQPVRIAEVVESPGPRSQHAQLNDRDWLADRIGKHSIYAIAAELGCDRRAVRCALVRHDLTWDHQRTRSGVRRAA